MAADKAALVSGWSWPARRRHAVCHRTGASARVSLANPADGALSPFDRLRVAGSGSANDPFRAVLENSARGWRSLAFRSWRLEGVCVFRVDSRWGVRRGSDPAGEVLASQTRHLFQCLSNALVNLTITRGTSLPNLVLRYLHFGREIASHSGRRDLEATVLNALRNFMENVAAATPLEMSLIAAVVAVAFVDVLISRGPNLSGEISQVSFR